MEGLYTVIDAATQEALIERADWPQLLAWGDQNPFARQVDVRIDRSQRPAAFTFYVRRSTEPSTPARTISLNRASSLMRQHAIAAIAIERRQSVSLVTGLIEAKHKEVCRRFEELVTIGVECALIMAQGGHVELTAA